MQKEILEIRPRVSDVRDGTFRPEAVIRNTGGGDIEFGESMPTVEAAEKSARALCEQIGGDGEWNGDWYVVAINMRGVWACLETARVLLSKEMATPLGKRLHKELDLINEAVAAAIDAVAAVPRAAA